MRLECETNSAPGSVLPWRPTALMLGVVIAAWVWLYAVMWDAVPRPVEVVGLVCFWPLVLGTYPATAGNMPMLLRFLLASTPMAVYFLVIRVFALAIGRFTPRRWRIVGVGFGCILFIGIGLEVTRLLKSAH